MTILKYAMVFLIFLLGCGRPVVPKQPVMFLFLDVTELSSDQAALVDEAAAEITRQTHDCVQFEHGPGVRILRMVPADKYDTKAPVTYAYGMCNPTVGHCQTIELAFARFQERDTARRIVMHELGHALGLYHSKAEWTLMYADVDHSGYHFAAGTLLPCID